MLVPGQGMVEKRELLSVVSGITSVGLTDSQFVLVGSFDATVKLWDTKSNSTKPLMTLSEAKDSVSCVVVIESEILAGSVDGRVRTYDVRTGKLTTDVFGSKLAIARLVYCRF
jgi:mitogen-activated protein kinase organizer 1